MVLNAPIDAAQDEVIFSAKYSFKRVCVILTIYCLLMSGWFGFACPIVDDIYDGIVAGEGLLHFLLLGSLLILPLLPVLDFGLNPLFFREIIFYPNRLKIVRRILGCKTVYYSNGTVEKGTMRDGYIIEPVPEKAHAQRTRFFYDIELLFFASEAAAPFRKILDYLSDDSSQKKLRVFKRSMLPRDVHLKGAVQP